MTFVRFAKFRLIRFRCLTFVLLGRQMASGGQTTVSTGEFPPGLAKDVDISVKRADSQWQMARIANVIRTSDDISALQVSIVASESALSVIETISDARLIGLPHIATPLQEVKQDRSIVAQAGPGFHLFISAFHTLTPNQEYGVQLKPECEDDAIPPSSHDDWTQRGRKTATKNRIHRQLHTSSGGVCIARCSKGYIYPINVQPEVVAVWKRCAETRRLCLCWHDRLWWFCYVVVKFGVYLEAYEPNALFSPIRMCHMLSGEIIPIIPSGAYSLVAMQRFYRANY